MPRSLKFLWPPAAIANAASAAGKHVLARMRLNVKDGKLGIGERHEEGVSGLRLRLKNWNGRPECLVCMSYEVDGSSANDSIRSQEREG